jgi:hypothetical protein
MEAGTYPVISFVQVLSYKHRPFLNEDTFVLGAGRIESRLILNHHLLLENSVEYWYTGSCFTLSGVCVTLVIVTSSQADPVPFLLTKRVREPVVMSKHKNDHKFATFGVQGPILREDCT